MSETTEILKLDETGRVRTPSEKQEAALEEIERNGMTGMQFARHVGVPLCDWVMLGARWMRLIFEEVRASVLDAGYPRPQPMPLTIGRASSG